MNGGAALGAPVAALDRGSPVAPGVVLGNCRVLAGTSSWADRSLVRDGTFYPSRSLTAAERLAYYASRLPLTEVATTYRFPPTPDVAKRWVASTPPGFTMDIRAWSLLSGAPTWPESLWPDLQGHMKPPRKEGAKLYRHHLAAEVVEECWERFRHALHPLLLAGRLGAVILRFPTWFRPRPSSWEELALLPSRLPGFRLAVELTSHHWFDGGSCEHTLSLLEGLGLGLVCSDHPGPGRPVVAATSQTAFVRFPGRSAHSWYMPPQHQAQTGPDVQTEEAEALGTQPLQPLGPLALGPLALGPLGPEPTEPAPLELAEPEPIAWWSYRYNEAELAEWVPAIRDLASGTTEVHLIMDNCWRADAVDNAGSLLDLLAAT
ncbi:MAG TPA: DUF72 domain-containing protein [Acidimicrobiales bacterium]|nr:DUF72 domain-containing protein [Acidimicrobiales bacterium]